MEYLFVYGLFRDTAKGLLEKSKFIKESSIDGNLYYVNEFYPGFVKGDGKVIGNIYEIEYSILEKLDEFEGDEYNRIRVVSDKFDCWVYEYKYDVSNLKPIKNGDWFLR